MWVAACALLLALPRPAQAQTLNLSQCLQQALAQNQQVRRTLLNRDANELMVQEAWSGYFPQVNASSQLDYNHAIQRMAIPGEMFGRPIAAQFGTKYNWTMGLNISQVIYNHAIFQGVKAIQSQAHAVELQRQMTEEQVMYSIASLYYNLQVLEQQERLITAELASLDSTTNIVRLQAQQGVALPLNADRLAVTRNNLVAESENLAQMRKEALNTLKLLMGSGPDANVALTPLDVEGTAIPTDIPGASPENRLDIRLLHTQAELTERVMGTTRAGYFPTLAVNWRQGYNALRNELDFFDSRQQWFYSGVVSLQLNVPIFDGLRKHRQLQQKHIELRQLALDLEQATLNAQTEYQNAVGDLQRSRTQIDRLQQNLAIAQQVYSVTSQQYAQGTATLSDLLQANSGVREARNHYTTALINYRLAYLDVLKATGNLRQLMN
jgi:outer membrane protein TolC